MTRILYLRLDYPSPGEAAWCTSDGENGSGALAGVVTAATGRRVVVFVAGTEVLLLGATVPTRKRERLLQAVPYALEEHLAADVETLHFALGRPSPGEGNTSLGDIPVAVVARTRMDAWLAALGEEGIAPHALVPDFLALPILPGSWTLLREPGAALLRTGPQSGLALDPEWLPMALEQTSAPPLCLRVANGSLPPSPSSPSFLSALPPLTVPVEELPCPNGSSALLMEGYRPGETIDLLQGPYSRREQFGRLWRPWRAAAVLLLAFGTLQFVDLALEYQRLAAEEVALRTRMTDIYLHAFPDARKVVNPRVQMEQRLNALRTQPDGVSSGLLGLLARAAPVLGATEGLELRTLRYKDGSIELDLSLKDLQLLDRLKQRLADTSLEVEIRSARAQGETVEAHLQIRGLNK
ncbi:Type II secretion system protein L [Gammaproteobacteria bacterium]